MNQDVIRELGYLTLGTRLKRLGDRMQQQTQVILSNHDIDVPAAQLPLLAAVDRVGSASVGALAQALGVAQPGVTRLAGKLEQGGLLETAPSGGDRRIRTLRLTPKGRALIARARAAAWPMVEAAVVELCGDHPVLQTLAALEDALDLKPLSQRAELAKANP